MFIADPTFLLVCFVYLAWIGFIIWGSLRSRFKIIKEKGFNRFAILSFLLILSWLFFPLFLGLVVYLFIGGESGVEAIFYYYACPLVFISFISGIKALEEVIRKKEKGLLLAVTGTILGAFFSLIVFVFFIGDYFL